MKGKVGRVALISWLHSVKHPRLRLGIYLSIPSPAIQRQVASTSSILSRLMVELFPPGTEDREPARRGLHTLDIQLHLSKHSSLRKGNEKLLIIGPDTDEHGLE